MGAGSHPHAVKATSFIMENRLGTVESTVENHHHKRNWNHLMVLPHAVKVYRKLKTLEMLIEDFSKMITPINGFHVYICQ